MSILLQDFQVALRFFARRRAAFAVIVLTLGLALGANTVVFSILKAFLFSSLSVPETGRVFVVNPTRDLPGRGAVQFNEAYPNYKLLRERQHSFGSLAAIHQNDMNWEDNGEVRRLQASRVTAGFFAVMNLQPILGHAFTSRDEGPRAAPLVLIGHTLWHSSFNGDPNVVGRTMRINGTLHTIIGVMPAGFVQPAPTDIWLPFDVPESFWNSVVGARQLTVMGRLANGVSTQAAAAELRALTPVIAASNPGNKDFYYAAQTLRANILSGADSIVLFVQAGAAVLLLLAISNLSSVLVAWAFERQHETAVRLALGASRGQIARQFIVQSVALLGGGGLLGCALAVIILPLVRELNPNPALALMLAEARLDAGALGFTAAIVFGAGLLAGLLPVWHSGRTDLVDSLKAVSRGATLTPMALRWQKAMVLVQTAIAVVILAAAALVGVSFRNLSRVDGGFQDAGRVVLRVQLPDTSYPTPAARVAFQRALDDNLAREPELARSGLSSTIPVGDGTWGAQFHVQQPGGDFTQDPALFHVRRVSSSYLEAIGIPLLRGRQFDQRDRSDSPPVTIVSQTLAHRFWPGENPIGKRLRRVSGNIVAEVVGVVGNVMDSGYSSPPGETVYVPFGQWPVRQLNLVVQPRSTPEAGLAAARRALKTTDPTLAPYNAASLTSLVQRANALARLQMLLLLGFAFIAIAITALGSYGVMSQLVTNRERELAVRLAVGAPANALGRAVLGQNALLSLGGIALGLVVSWLLGGVLQGFVFGIAPHNPALLAGVAGLTLLLTLAATAVPAWRAAHVDVRRVVGSS